MIAKVVLLFLLSSFSLFGQYRLSMCTIFNNEAPFLKEWIEFHKIQGFEHFYLYNNNSTDNYQSVLRPYIRLGLVTLVEWPMSYHEGNTSEWNKVQCQAYMHCVKQYGEKNAWIAFLDTDEFLFCPSGKKVSQFLTRYRSYAAVCANWHMFGTSHLEEIPPQACLIEKLRKCASLGCSYNQSFKSIAQPKCIKEFITPHSCVLYEGFVTVDADGNVMTSTYHCGHEPRYDKICINHYWARTEKFYRERKLARAAKWGYTLDPNFVISLNACEDATIQQFVPKLRKRMGFK
jgi:hypothetical protein